MNGVWVAAIAALIAAGISLWGVILTIKGNRSTEQFRQKGQFSLVAADRRIELHQEAFLLWLELHHAVKTPSDDAADKRLYEEGKRCWVWWTKHCLYFDPKVDRELLTATINAGRYAREDLRRDMNPEEKEKILKQIHHTPNVIRQAVGLPNLSGEIEFLPKRT